MTAVMGGALEHAMVRYAGGDDAALGDVYDLLAPQLFGFLLRLTRDRAAAEDLCHETFLRIHRARSSYRPGAEVRPWALSIGRRLFLDLVRARRRESLSLDEPRGERPSDPGVASPEPQADERAAATELEREIERVLARLPERQATAFRLLKQEGLSVAEAAEVLGTTALGVKLRAHRAYDALRAALGREWDLPARPGKERT
ncbi:MAG: RNA polymerase sigma factor [Polyangiaceae bacterium]|nr:RNA polymerase sigma factor [Polyangiaceae bacterium]